MSDSGDFTLGSVEVSSSPCDRFVEFLESRGKRVTQQRRFLVEQVFRRHEHFEADDLVEEFAQGGDQKISRPTIYRTLGEMVEAGLLRKMSLQGRTVYEHDYGYPQHDHLHCHECQKLIEFHSAELETLRQAVGEEHDFRVEGHRLVISGICAECRRARHRRRRPVDRV